MMYVRSIDMMQYCVCILEVYPGMAENAKNGDVTTIQHYTIHYCMGM